MSHKYKGTTMVCKVLYIKKQQNREGKEDNSSNNRGKMTGRATLQSCSRGTEDYWMTFLASGGLFRERSAARVAICLVYCSGACQ